MSEQHSSQESTAEILLFGNLEECVPLIQEVLEPFSYHIGCFQALDDLQKSLVPEAEQVVVIGSTFAQEALAALKTCATTAPGVPVIVVSDRCDRAFTAALMHSGASDHISRDRLHCLGWAIKRELFHRRARRKALESAGEAERVKSRMTELLRLAPDAIVCADSDHRITVFNQAAEKIFGYSAEEIIGCQLDQLLPVRYRSAHRRHMAHFRDSRLPAREMGNRGGIVALRKDGTEFPAEASIAVLRGDPALYVAILRDVTEKKRAAQRLEYLATHDSLTGLPNRMLLVDRLSHAIARAEREEEMVALLFVDLDGFKQINDSFGHAAGDELLRAVAKRIAGCVRGADTVGRLGGDEFAVILEALRHADGAASIAGHIIDRLREPFRLANSVVSISASIGITICPFDTKDVDRLLIDADRAMYAAKAAGKNRFEFYSRECADIDTCSPAVPEG